MNRSRELAELLLRKAAQDAYVLEKLSADPDASEEVIGFHAQQAVEKAVKAVLAEAGIRFPHTHDLLELIDLAQSHGFSFPIEAQAMDRLTPYAVGLRYADQASSFDRQWAVETARRARAWAESIIGQP